VTSKAATASMAVTCMLLLAACGVPIPGESAPSPVERPRPGADVDTLVPIDAGGSALTAQLLLIAGRTAEVSDVLARVEDASDATLDDTELRELGGRAVALMLGGPGGGSGVGLLPAIAPDRAGTSTDDLITGLITYACYFGCDRSRIVMELVRDPLVGDLGAWQRDPVGVITLLRSIADDHVAPGSDPAALDAALLGIPGGLTRALGYALVVATTEDRAIATHAADRGVGHLSVVGIAVELAVERIAGS